MDSIRSVINDVLKSVYDQQKIAETKHAGLLAFNGVLISALLKYFDILSNSPFFITLSIIFAVAGGVLLLVSVVFSAWSFFPMLGTTPATHHCLPDTMTSNPEKGSLICPSTKENCVLKQKITADMRVMSFLAAKDFDYGGDYLCAFIQVHGNDNIHGVCHDDYAMQLAAQVVYNSKIVFKKYRTFKNASIISISGSIYVLAGFIINLLSA